MRSSTPKSSMIGAILGAVRVPTTHHILPGYFKALDSGSMYVKDGGLNLMACKENKVGKTR
jgi:hypothetical protein